MRVQLPCVIYFRIQKKCVRGKPCAGRQWQGSCRVNLSPFLDDVKFQNLECETMQPSNLLHNVSLSRSYSHEWVGVFREIPLMSNERTDDERYSA